MSGQDYEFLGDERCDILLSIKEEIQNFESLSKQDAETLEWAIDVLLERYGCCFEDG